GFWFFMPRFEAAAKEAALAKSKEEIDELKSIINETKSKKNIAERNLGDLRTLLQRGTIEMLGQQSPAANKALQLVRVLEVGSLQQVATFNPAVKALLAEPPQLKDDEVVLRSVLSADYEGATVGF